MSRELMRNFCATSAYTVGSLRPLRGPASYRVQTNLTKWKSRGLLCTKCILILTQNLYKILDVINGFTVSLLFCLYCISILYITNKSNGISLKFTQFVLIYHYIVKYHGQSKTPKDSLLALVFWIVHVNIYSFHNIFVSINTAENVHV